MARYRCHIPDSFLADLAQIGPEGYDWNDSLRGIKWYLEHDPLKVGFGTQDTEVRIFLQDRPRELSGVKVFYVVEGQTVTLLRARAYTPEPED